MFYWCRNHNYFVEVVGTIGVVEADGIIVGLAEFADTDDVAVGDAEVAPIRCCNNSAIRIVVLSIADLGR